MEGDAPGTRGISLFAVPKIRVNPDGSLGERNDVDTVNIEHKMGIKGSSTCTLAFGENDNCIGWLVGKQSKGMSMMFQMMNEARLMVGLQGQATAAAAYENALDYAKERIQGNKTAIIEYPDVRRMLITQKSYVEGMRALLLYCAYLQDQIDTGSDEAKVARTQGRLDLLVPICKAYCTDMGFRATELAVQTYGGYGYCSEYPAEQFCRDVKISSIYEGTNGIQALDLIGRKLSINQGQLFREFYEDLSAFCAKHADHAAFKEEVSATKKGLDDLAQVTMKFGEWAMGKNFISPQLHAVPYLYNMGDVVLSWLMVDQSILALEKLEAIWKEKGATDEESKSKLCQEDDEARFYEGKIKATRFFIHHILPGAKARTKAMLGGDESAMKIRF